MTTKTPGEQLAAELRRYFSVGTRTRRRRRHPFGHMQDLHADMIEVIETNNQYPGFFTPTMTEILRPAFAVALSYRKHYGGYRMTPGLHRYIELMSPYQFAAMLGQMLDADVTNVGEGEQFFSAMNTEIRKLRNPR